MVTLQNTTSSAPNTRQAWILHPVPHRDLLSRTNMFAAFHTPNRDGSPWRPIPPETERRIELAHSEAAREQRFAMVVDALQRKRIELTKAINSMHADAGDCLPLPVFDIPDTPEALPALSRTIRENLYDDTGNWARPWLIAIDRTIGCPHLSEKQVGLANYLVCHWYYLINDGRREVDPIPGEYCRDFQQTQEFATYWASKAYAGPDFPWFTSVR
ncbi:hypothetical protein [Streptosporangium sp. CA-115845]|uniref:hypothetical protein n=1 Tax=Streptosporangium sp. CA-115845 TaxID=3240071 RepID=UPI003D9334C8